MKVIRILLTVIVSILGAGLLLACILFLIPGQSQAKTIVTSEPDVIQAQTLVKKQLLADYASGNYTMQDPYVVQDPYGTSPLSALVIFETEKPSQINVVVKGKDIFSTLSYTLKEFVTHHEVPVVGLYAGVENVVELTAVSEGERKTSKVVSIRTEPLPGEFPEIRRLVYEPEKMEPGWNLVNTERYKFIVDNDGQIRWFLNLVSNNILTVLPDGKLLVAFTPTPPYTTSDAPDKLVVVDLMGRYSKLYTTPMIHHDVIPYKDSYLSTVRDDLFEFNQAAGARINLTTSLWKHFSAERFFDYIEDSRSLHINALVTGGDLGEDVLISARNQHAIILIDYPENTLKWIAGPPEGWSEQFARYLLTPVGTEFEWFWMQHAPQVLPDFDRDLNTIDILVFDNGFYRGFQPSAPKENLYSRMVHYRINPTAKTIEQVWQYGKERGYELYSSIKSDAHYLPTTGNFLGTFAQVQSLIDKQRFDGVITEVTREKEVVLELRLLDTPFIYRSQRILVDYLIGDSDEDVSGEVLRFNSPESQRYFPSVELITGTSASRFNLVNICIEKFGQNCHRFLSYANRTGLSAALGLQPLRVVLDSASLVDTQLSLAGQVELPDNEQGQLFLVLKGESMSQAYDLSGAKFKDQDENDLTPFFINELEIVDLPEGSYQVCFVFSSSGRNLLITTDTYLEIKRELERVYE